MAEKQYTEIRSVQDVTDEIVGIVWGKVEGWYDGKRIDWEDVWDRADGALLDDGTYLDLGDALDSPALSEIQKRIIAMRRASL
jgi:hypothetical protein